MDRQGKVRPRQQVEVVPVPLLVLSEQQVERQLLLPTLFLYRARRAAQDSRGISLLRVGQVEAVVFPSLRGPLVGVLSIAVEPVVLAAVAISTTEKMAVLVVKAVPTLSEAVVLAEQTVRQEPQGPQDRQTSTAPAAEVAVVLLVAVVSVELPEEQEERGGRQVAAEAVAVPVLTTEEVHRWAALVEQEDGGKFGSTHGDVSMTTLK